MMEWNGMETLIPNRFLTFTFPSDTISPEPIRVAVLDSPLQPPSTATSPPPPPPPPLVAAMHVPLHRESDWIFSTEAGHLELLLSVPHLSRLVLLGHLPHPLPPSHYTRPIPPFTNNHLPLLLKPLLSALSLPTSSSSSLFDIPFLSYQDDLLHSSIVQLCSGPIVGDLLVEDVHLEHGGFRRRLRFKRMPHLIQTEMLILSSSSSSGGHCLDTACLVHPYLAPMVASLSLISHNIDKRGEAMPRALCLGVGGGALLSFLVSHLGFQVVGVEEDETVLRVAKTFFSLQEGDSSRLIVGDAIDYLKKESRHGGGCGGGYDVVFVDMDSREAGSGIVAPPLEFVEMNVLRDVKRIMTENGVVVVNVMPPSGPFYEMLLGVMKVVYHEGYQADADNDDNIVVIGVAGDAVYRVDGGEGVEESAFLTLLKGAVGCNYISSIQKIWGE